MKKIFFALVPALILSMAACKKNNQHNVILVEYYLSGNEISVDSEGDIDQCSGLVYKNEKVLHNLGKDNYAADVCANNTDTYTCGCKYDFSENKKYPRVWKNTEEMNSPLNGKEGEFHQILLFNSDVLTIGNIGDKGVFANNGEIAYEYGTEGETVVFKCFNIDYNGRFVIAGTVDGKVRIWKLVKIDGKYVLENVYKIDVPGMKYDEYSYDVYDIFIPYNSFGQTFVALTRASYTTGETEGCFCTENQLYTLGESGRNSNAYSISSFRNNIMLGGCIADKNGVQKAAVWDDGFKMWNDFSVGLGDNTPSSIVKMYNDSYGVLHVCMLGVGKVQFQMIGTNNPPFEFKVADKFIPTGMSMTFRQEVVTE